MHFKGLKGKNIRNIWMFAILTGFWNFTCLSLTDIAQKKAREYSKPCKNRAHPSRTNSISLLAILLCTAILCIAILRRLCCWGQCFNDAFQSCFWQGNCGFMPFMVTHQIAIYWVKLANVYTILNRSLDEKQKSIKSCNPTRGWDHINVLLKTLHFIWPH